MQLIKCIPTFTKITTITELFLTPNCTDQDTTLSQQHFNQFQQSPKAIVFVYSPWSINVKYLKESGKLEKFMEYSNKDVSFYSVYEQDWQSTFEPWVTLEQSTENDVGKYRAKMYWFEQGKHLGSVTNAAAVCEDYKKGHEDLVQYDQCIWKKGDQECSCPDHPTHDENEL